MNNTRQAQLSKLISNLESFIDKRDHMINMAKKIEADIDELFSDDDIADNFISELALYSPGGGDYLLSHDDILPLAKSVLHWLKKHENYQ